MNFKQLFLLIISGLLTNIFCVSGQDMPLSIEQMFELCDQNSRNLKLSATEVEKAQQSTRELKVRFRLLLASTYLPTIWVGLLFLSISATTTIR